MKCGLIMQELCQYPDTVERLRLWRRSELILTEFLSVIIQRKMFKKCTANPSTYIEMTMKYQDGQGCKVLLRTCPMLGPDPKFRKCCPKWMGRYVCRYVGRYVTTVVTCSSCCRFGPIRRWKREQDWAPAVMVVYPSPLKPNCQRGRVGPTEHHS